MADLESIETKWQTRWAQEGLGKAVRDTKKPKFFMIFAYPGISGYMHFGHMRGYSYTDAFCRYKRLRGFNVLFPVGTHASGNQASAFAQKIKKGDPAWKEYMISNGCTEKELSSMTEPQKIVDYFNKVYVNDFWKRFGFLCDWDRFTCTTYPDYNRFIAWQFQKLNKAGLLAQKPYFATACPNCGPVAVDPSETDISKGGNAEKNEYVLLKFKMGDKFLVAATLRPETVFGQTNLWINPDHEYVEVEVGTERWVISGPCAGKLGFQKDAVKTVGRVDPKKLIGKMAVAPGVNREIVILPASFCDPHVGTGIVTSVPSDAPYDWIALHDLQKDEARCRLFGLKAADVQSVKPIPIIKTKGFGEFPAIEICKKMGITSQNESEKLDEATKEIYKAGFHQGTMADTCGKYHGMPVASAKEMVKEDLITSGAADCFHDLSEEVVCRCGMSVVIKKIDDQWFIKYSDPALTEKSKKHAATMNVVPKEYHNNLPSVLDWFSDRACARLGNWLGSPLPFDKKWIIEPISDSTLYPLYYLVSGYVNDGTLNAGHLTEEFFDYVALGIGKAGDVSKKIKVPEEVLEKIKADISYWYPLDINLGGKEHQTVHFPVFIMNHVGILRPNQWPKGIFVNAWVTGKGGKISKSKGGAQPLSSAISRFGVDAIRMYYAHIGSPDSDVVWDEDIIINYRNALERTLALAGELVASSKEHKGKAKPVDVWLESRLNSRIGPVTASFEGFNLREAATQVYFGMTEDLRWYSRRGGDNKKLIKEYLCALSVMMTPLTPHVAEELHSIAGGKGLSSVAKWPVPNASKINKSIESQEDRLLVLINDVRAVMKLAKIENPSRLILITAAGWTYPLYERLKKQIAVTRDAGMVIKSVMADETLREHGKDVTKIIAGVLKDPSKLPDVVSKPSDELSALKESSKLLEEELGFKVDVMSAEDSNHPKAGSAMPGKPAIVIE
ncbi:MAG: leucine--tRNA ligase [Nanoarchaeota archaeon]